MPLALVDQRVGKRGRGGEKRAASASSGSYAWALDSIVCMAEGLGDRRWMHQIPPNSRRHPRRSRTDQGLGDPHADADEPRPCREIIGAEVWLKFENLQFTAAYKERGALNKLLQLTDEERRRGVDRRLGRQSRAGRRLSRPRGWAFR